MNSFLIEPATEEDIPIIQDIAAHVWPQTYSPIISKEQIAYMLDAMYSTASLQEQMRSGHVFLIARQDEFPVGFASYSKEADDNIYKLQKIYVRIDRQQAGCGAALLRTVLNELREKKGNHLILQVNRNNSKAVGFYQRMGFIIQNEVDLEIGNGFQMNDYIMEISF